MAKTNNLGRYLHPIKSSGEGSPADEKQDAAGRARTGMTQKQWEQSPEDKAEDRAKSASVPVPRDLTAEERFYRSASPAPVKGTR